MGSFLLTLSAIENQAFFPCLRLGSAHEVYLVPVLVLQFMTPGSWEVNGLNEVLCLGLGLACFAKNNLFAINILCEKCFQKE